MKTLFTAEAVSKGGRSGTLKSPEGLLNTTERKEEEKSSAALPWESIKSEVGWFIIQG